VRNLRNFRQVGRLLISSLATATLVAASASAATAAPHSTKPNASKSVTLTWWNNATSGVLLKVWQNAIKSFEATHPGVKIQNVPIQNEVLQDTKIPVALSSGSPPDIFQQWGGGSEATQVTSGELMNMTMATSGWIKTVGAVADGWQVSGQQYGIPYDLHIVGFWYRKDLFTKAGISSPPATLNQLESDVTKLKAAGIAPISVGSKDKWPDAFWWEYFALRECSTGVLQKAMKSINLSNSCFVKAGNAMTAFMKTNPFQTGFLATPAQTGAGSSAGLVANGQAAMELQGDWDPGVIDSLTTSKTINSDLGWFPFPSIPGGAGDPHTVLGGGDGFSCSKSAGPACVQFLEYLDSASVQKQVAGASTGLPANPAAAPALTLPALKQVLSYYKATPFLQTYFDIAFPTNVGQALDAAVANYFAGAGTPQAIIQAVAQSAKKAG
jgi:raffinose/stachyose/melibiose transport system substrate-binding protein